MGHAVGYTCDYARCGKFQVAEGDKQVPLGWITLAVHLNGHRPEGEPASLMLCSNRCLVKVAQERYAADPAKPARRGGRRKASEDDK